MDLRPVGFRGAARAPAKKEFPKFMTRAMERLSYKVLSHSGIIHGITFFSSASNTWVPTRSALTSCVQLLQAPKQSDKALAALLGLPWSPHITSSLPVSVTSPICSPPCNWSQRREKQAKGSMAENPDGDHRKTENFGGPDSSAEGAASAANTAKG